VQRRLQAVLACCAALAAGACGDAEGMEIQELPPLRRPTAEARAGLPEVRGVWRFAGFEIPAADTTAVREQVYTMTPPGELRVITQRLDSIAGQYVRDGVAFPFSGEVRWDSALSLVAFSEGIGQFAAGHVRRDTFWIELTTFGSAQGWPRGTRAALVRRVGGPPFRRLLGGAPIYVPVDSTRMLDSIRMDSLRRAGAALPPGAVAPPAGQPVPGQAYPAPGGQPVVVPGAQPARPTVPAGQPQRPPVQAQPRPQQPQPPPAQAQPRPQPQRPPVEPAPAQQPVNEPAVQPTPPRPDAPKDTVRFGIPP
jgi:hypothetical protein